MGMASKQELPIETNQKLGWSMRRLFPMAAVSKALAKNFINIFDVLLAFSIFIIGVCELANREVSWLFYILTVLLLASAVVERRANTTDITPIKEKKK